LIQDTIAQPIGHEIMEPRRWNNEEKLHALNVSNQASPATRISQKNKFL